MDLAAVAWLVLHPRGKSDLDPHVIAVAPFDLLDTRLQILPAFRQHVLLGGTQPGTHVLVAAARYLAAHAPTVRAEGQTFQIARRPSRGERLFEAP